jgi:hypothetical protein
MKIMKKFLFICGAPRSGTTLLAKVLGSNPSVVMGIERYKNVISTDRFKANLFEVNRFFDFQAADSNINYKHFQNHYDFARKKYAGAMYVGDKIPNMYKHLGKLSDYFEGDVKIIFCYRNPYAVAASWNARAFNPNDAWPEVNDYQKAIKFWNESLNHAIVAHKAGAKIIPFNFDSFTDTNKTSGLEYYSKLLYQLDLSLSDEDSQTFELEIARASIIGKKRQPLEKNMNEFINANIDNELLLKFISTFKCGTNGFPKSMVVALVEKLKSRTNHLLAQIEGNRPQEPKA